MSKFSYEPDSQETMEEQQSRYEDYGNDVANEQMLDRAIEERDAKIKAVRDAFPERPDLFVESLQLKTDLSDSEIMSELFKHYPVSILKNYLIIKKSNS